MPVNANHGHGGARRLASVGAFVVVLAACSSSHPTATSSTTTSSTPATTTVTTSPPAVSTSSAPRSASTVAPTTILTTAPLRCAGGSSPADYNAHAGKYAVHLKKINVTARTVDFDPIQFLVGDKAVAAYRKDNPGATDGPPNDYYIVNASPRVYQAPVAGNVVVWDTRSQDGGSNALKPETFAGLVAVPRGAQDEQRVRCLQPVLAHAGERGGHHDLRAVGALRLARWRRELSQFGQSVDRLPRG